MSLEKVDVPPSREFRAGSFFYVSPLVFIVMQMLTPLVGGLREMPLRPETWQKKSIFNTNWARHWSHITARSDWGVIFDGRRCHFISQGSVIRNEMGMFVVQRVEQKPVKDMRNCTFSQLQKFQSADTQGAQRVLVYGIHVENQWVVRATTRPHWQRLDKMDRWDFCGQIEDYSVLNEINLPVSASSLTEGCTEDDHMFIFGMCMDGCSPYSFSRSLTGTHFLHLRPWCIRASFTHFGFACAAIPKGVDPSLAVAMLGRDIALIESGNLFCPRVMDDGVVRWQRIYAHLANFISDREGSDNPLGRIHAKAGTKCEWKGFIGCRDGFGIGPRNEGPHAFGGDSRIFRSVRALCKKGFQKLVHVCSVH